MRPSLSPRGGVCQNFLLFGKTEICSRLAKGEKQNKFDIFEDERSSLIREQKAKSEERLKEAECFVL